MDSDPFGLAPDQKSVFASLPELGLQLDLEDRVKRARIADLVQRLPASTDELLAEAVSEGNHEAAVDRLLGDALSAINERRRGSRKFDHVGHAIYCLDLVQRIEEQVKSRGSAAYEESISFTTSQMNFDQSIADCEEKLGRALTRRENDAIYALVYGSDGRSSEDFNERLAVDVVLHKMLSHWVSAGMEERLELFFINRLQLLDGNSDQAIRRETVSKRIKEATARYCLRGSLSDQYDVLEQVAARITYRLEQWPLFWFGGMSLEEHRESVTRRRQEKALARQVVGSWKCDSCSKEFPAGSSDREVIPERREACGDSRLSRPINADPERRAMPLRKLPNVALTGDSYMCSCWRERAGILRPQFLEGLG